ncbi:glycosyltransferase, partial [Pluralibacter gergoviae]|nr:glycosyltransferase [Pluralibacter gergoviae]
NTKYDFLNFFSSKDDLVSKKLVVIPNCFNFSSNIRASTLANKDCYRSGVVFLYVGSEEARKNLLTSIVALSRIQYEEKITFIKIGKPIITENRAKLMEFLGTTSLNYQVSDYVSQSDLEEYFLQCDFFIMPTLHEGFGRTPIEAQSYGKIVIASDIPIMREIMGDSALYVKDPHLEASWITAFYNALKLDNEKIRLYQFKARENAARYAIENVVREFESEVLNSPQ